MSVVDTGKQVKFDLKIEYANQLPNGSTSISENCWHKQPSVTTAVKKIDKYF
jgi:hypothetical protein